MSTVVKLDFSSVQSARQILRHLRLGCSTECSIVASIADQIEAQIPKPRIEQPGLWGVVKARREGSTLMSKYLRRYAKDNGGYDWVDIRFGTDGNSLLWDDLLDPVLVREGVES